jgi:penicillin-binding protein 1A
VEQADGEPLVQRTPQVSEVISVDIAREMMVLLRAVVQHGTAAAASSLQRELGGKTGTTNDYTDAWFIGFSPSVTCGTWIGFDNRQSLGEKETGARAALPMWMDFMKVALADKAGDAFSKPNAPKKSIELPLIPLGGGAPILELPPAKSDDQPDSSDDTGNNTVVVPATPPAASVPTTTPNDAPEAPAPIVRQTPRGSKPVVPKPVPVRIPPSAVGVPH